MVMWQPWVRILLRYGVGAVAGVSAGEAWASDADLVNALAVVAALIAARATEWWYQRAKREGGPT